MRMVLGGSAERIAAPQAALHPIPDGLPFAAAAMAEPLAACVHAVGRGTRAREVTVLGGGTVGLMLARLLVLDGRDVTVADRHPERRGQAQRLGARGAEKPPAADLVFEAVGRPEAWAAAVTAARPGGAVVLVGGCPHGSDVALPAGPLHYDELEVRGAYHHTPAEVDEALALLAGGAVDWGELAGEVVGLDGLAAALERACAGEARKVVVDPRR
jgi:L-iditol 2-dehydrogenase